MCCIQNRLKIMEISIRKYIADRHIEKNGEWFEKFCNSFLKILGLHFKVFLTSVLIE